MIGVNVKVEDQTKKVVAAGEKAAYRNLRHAAASISKDMKASLETAPGPSAPGEAPHTHKGAYLRRAVRYFADQESAVIGPMASIVGEAGAAHEHGEEFHGTDYPDRPFAGPALERNEGRLLDDWRGTIGE